MIGPRVSATLRYFTQSRVHPMPFHSHVNFEIYYLHVGKGNYLIGDKIYVLQPGDLIIMNGMTLHCSNIDPQSEYKRSTLHFNPAHIRELLAPFHTEYVLKPFRELGNLRIQLKGEDKLAVEDMLYRMDKLYKQEDDISRSRFLLIFLELLHLIYRLCERPLEVRNDFPSEKERHVQNVIDYVEKHYREDLNFEMLGKSIHLNKSYLSKIFKDVTGFTLFKYVYQRRINQAKIMFLLDSQRSVTDVCYQVGFKHLAHFSRIFKEQVGCSPEQYKKMNINAKN